MMLIIMVLQLSMEKLMDKELFQVEHKDKLESGELLNKNNLCKHLLNNIVVEFGQFKLTKIVVK